MTQEEELLVRAWDEIVSEQLRRDPNCFPHPRTESESELKEKVDYIRYRNHSEMTEQEERDAAFGIAQIAAQFKAQFPRVFHTDASQQPNNTNNTQE